MLKFFCRTKLKRVFSRITVEHVLPASLAFFVFCIILFLTGLSDFFFEVNFRHFKWPPYVDVRNQVVRELLGQPSEYVYYNDWHNFATVIQPDCRNNKMTRRRFLLMIVKTAPDRLEHREAVRKTYGSIREMYGFRIRTIFVMGLPHEDELAEKSAVFNEAAQYGDLLIGNFSDHYRNNTYKTVPYLFLVDDDYLISMPNLLAEIQRHPPNEQVYMGYRFISSPFRLFFRKHQISLAEYPYAAYPPYITAGAVLMTGQTVKEFYLAVQHVQIFKYDDVYAGIIAYLLGIRAQHNDNFLFTYPQPSDPHEEFQQWRSIIASHGFTPATIREKYPFTVAPSFDTLLGNRGKTPKA